MTSIAGYARTGRQLLGPGSDLVEVQKPDGTRLTAIVFHPEYRAHNAINAALHVVYGFLESPMVSGLAELVAHDRDAAGFLYATGQVWSVAEVIRTLSDLGESGGARAGLELLAQAGTILVEAAETGENAGVYSHGGLTPWRVMLDADGRVDLIGHALPQVEILVFHESPDRIPREDAFRYCPPERMEARRENFTSDLFGLALIAFELMTGRPVYDGLINDIRTKAARGETSRRLQQFKDALAPAVREVLTTAMRPEIRDRFPSGEAFLGAVEEALADPSVTGPSLREVMHRIARHQPRARQELDPGRTSMLSKDELKRLAQEEDDAPARPARATFTPAARAPAPAAPPPAAAPPPPAPPNPLTSSSAGLPAARRPPRLTSSSAGEPAEPVGVPARAAPSVATSVPNRGSAPAGQPLPAPARPPPPAESEPAPPASVAGTSLPARGARLPPARSAPPTEAPTPIVPPAPQLAAPPAPAPMAPPAAPQAPPGGPPLGAARLPPSRRPPPGAEGSSVVEQILSRSGDSGRDMRERVERAMRDSGGSAAPPAPLPAPPPFEAPAAPPAAPPVAAGGFVEVELTGARPAAPELRVVEEDDGDPVTGPPQPAAPVAAPVPASPTRVEPPRAAAPVRAPLPPPPPLPADEPVTSPRPAPPPVAPRPAVPPPPPPPVEESTLPTRPVPPPVSPARPPAPLPSPAPPARAPAPEPAPAPPARAPAPEPAASIRKLSASSTTNLRAPVPLRAPPRGEPVAVRFARAPGLKGHRRRLPDDTTLAEAAQQLVGQLVPVRCSPDGRLLGWYRLGTAAGPLPVDSTVGLLDDEDTHVLHFVENQLVWLQVRVNGQGLRMPVGVAVPVASLIDGFALQFELPEGTWQLWLDGVLLDDFHILADHPVSGTSVLELRRGS